MKKTLATLATAALLCTVAPAHAGNGTVTFPEYQRVHKGWSRDHVQRVFGTTGRFRGLYATGTHTVLTKSYPTDTKDTTVWITYHGPLNDHPHEGPWHVVHKELR